MKLTIFVLIQFIFFHSIGHSETKIPTSDEVFDEAVDGTWIPISPNEKLNTKLDSHFPAQSPIEKVMSYQTSVKRQKSRGTCTIFSTLGLLESHLKRLEILEGHSPVDWDLSEEWLEYLAMRNKTSEGSTTSTNMRLILSEGIATEEIWPYIGKKWLTVDDSPLAKERCDQLEGSTQLSCLWGHRAPQLLTLEDHLLNNPEHPFFDPEFVTIRKNAKENLKNLIKRNFKVRKSFKINDLKWVKSYLNKGFPLIMGTRLYYGSWNHSKTDKFDIQERDKSKWYQGIVGYPEPGSKDKLICDEKGGGHSLIIVGYDDEKVIKTRMLMENGEWKEFTYKGVYYFKNSWGTHSFGRDFNFKGRSMPGYGMITQKYAHEYGRFFHYPVRQ